MLSSNSLPQKPVVSPEGQGAGRFGTRHHQDPLTHRPGRFFPPAEKSRPRNWTRLRGQPPGFSGASPSICYSARFGQQNRAIKTYLVYHIREGISTNNIEKTFLRDRVGGLCFYCFFSPGAPPRGPEPVLWAKKQRLFKSSRRAGRQGRTCQSGALGGLEPGPPVSRCNRAPSYRRC